MLKNTNNLFHAHGHLSHILPSSIVDVDAAIGHVQEDGGHIGSYFVASRDSVLEILIEDWPWCCEHRSTED